MLVEHLLSVTLVTGHKIEKINDLLLVFDCISNPLIGSDRIILYTSNRDLPLSETIMTKRRGCSLCGFCSIVYGGRCSLMGSIAFHRMGMNILCYLSRSVIVGVLG